MIDASGTWTQPNPMASMAWPFRAKPGVGSHRLWHSRRRRRVARDYAGKRVLVVGSGHSAINVALALMELQEEAPSTEIFWALRSNSVDKLLGGGLNDELPERGALGLAAKAAMDDGRLRMLAPFAVERSCRQGQMAPRYRRCLAVQPFELDVDRIVVATGFRPDFSFLRELRVELDPAVEAPPGLAPLIDPNFHSCGTVPPHGIAELAHPEPGFTIVGSKSYGRAPTFLMATGYEQVRSVVADIAGDQEAARDVQLVLPETGVCSADPSPAGERRRRWLLRRPGARVRRCLLRRRCEGQERRQIRMRVRRAPRPSRGWKPPNERRRQVPASAIWAFGVTQIVGYGTLFYSYSILAPAVADELGWSQQWVFAILSASLLASAVLAPIAGHWADRFGAGRLLVPGSWRPRRRLLFCALAPGRFGFAIGVLAMQLASCFVLYSTAFVAIVQLGGRDAQRSITHLTLIAGFASTLFWPLTTALHEHFGWREIFAIFAVLNLGLCLPIHAWLARLRAAHAAGPTTKRRSQLPTSVGPPTRTSWSPVFVLMLAGFAVEGFVLSAILVHMVPLTAAVGLGAAGVFVASLFGPSQVASRLINMLFGRGVPQTWLALGATGALAAGLAVLLADRAVDPRRSPVRVLFGFGSGLMSIVGGTLPLELFGRAGYGAHVGWITAARQFSSAFAPFGLTFMMAAVGRIPGTLDQRDDRAVRHRGVCAHRVDAASAAKRRRRRRCAGARRRGGLTKCDLMSFSSFIDRALAAALIPLRRRRRCRLTSESAEFRKALPFPRPFRASRAACPAASRP